MNAHCDAGSASQLDVLTALGVFGDAERPAAGLRFADPSDEDAAVEDRARSYLAANCAHCHQPGGWQPPAMTLDLRLETSFADTETCDVFLQYFSPHRVGTMRIAPGDLDDSNLYQRMIHTGLGRMPPLATRVPDEVGLQVVADWIEQMSDCGP